jgi:uncharacterized damage-inducible protein DinB
MRQGFTAIRYFASTVAIGLALSLVTFAQQASGGQNPPPPAAKLQEYPASRIEAAVKEWTRARDYTKEYLDAMPEDGCSFKPTPEIRSFAEQMLHLAAANYSIGSRALGVASPMQGKDMEKMTELQSKAALTKAVGDSYDFVINSIKATPDSKLDERVAASGFNRPRAQLLAAAFEHQTHHRGQTTIYLRLKGVKPPQEKLF